MNLGSLRDFCGNLLDYDPTNATYETQLTALLNDAQSRILTDKPWDFCQREGDVDVRNDQAVTGLGLVNGSATVTGALFPLSINPILPGSLWDGYTLVIGSESYQIAWVSAANTLYLTSEFRGTTGTYSGTIKSREIYLPADTMSVMSVLDKSRGIPVPQMMLSKFERDEARLDPNLLGVAECYLPSQGRRVPAPRAVNGVATVTPGAGRGVRTLNIYMVNVIGPSHRVGSLYREDASAGFESGLSAVQTITLADNQEIELTPETLPNLTGLYRRYYFTCPDLGIKAPVRLVHAANSAPGLNVDTVSPAGGVTLQPNTSVATITSQSFQSRSIRYIRSNGVYQSFLLYPHPSLGASNAFAVRRLVAPSAMEEDQDVPLVPEAFSQIIAFAAMEQLALKVNNMPLSQAYARKRDVLFQSMEARYLGIAPRRIIKGDAVTSQRFWPNPFGPLTFTP